MNDRKTAQRSWLPIAADSSFSLANIPFGIITSPTRDVPRPAVAIGDHALDLAEFSHGGGFSALQSIEAQLGVFASKTLNAFAALGRPTHKQVREYLQDVFAEGTKHPEVLKSNEALRQRAILPLKDVQMHLPMDIGDYTDFYAGRHHAFNVGVLFRGPANALQPNYRYLPVGYHGRASSVVVSGTSLRRPWGQILENPAAEEKVPTFAPCKKLDIELELGAFLCKPSSLGEPIKLADADQHIFGVVLLNDWSARDVQAWEYVPLGPFNAKNFGTSISPWVVLADALAPFTGAGIENDAKLVSYLDNKEAAKVYDIQLEVELETSSGSKTTITKTNGRNLLWSFSQMLTHHSITGCPMRVGDLLGSGTISGTEEGTQGSLLEQSKGGKTPIVLADGSKRSFLEDGDTVTLRGVCIGDDGARVGFGDCVGKIEPALRLD